MSRIEYDPIQTGLRAIFKDWQETTFRIIIENPQGLNSREAWEKVNEKLGKDAISRASIINFLQDLLEGGILTADDQTGRGGHHNVYKPAMNQTQLQQHIAETILQSLISEFPEETKKALKTVS